MMAGVNYDPVPTVTAREQTPDDLQHVEAGPNSFGAQIAQGVGEVGQGLGQAAQFYNKVAANNGNNNLLETVTKKLYGDPSKPATDANGNPILGPDGKPVPDTGYFGKRGADAMSARSDVMAFIDQAIQHEREGLSTPEARLEFDDESRRMRVQWAQKVGEFADQQQHAWSVDTNKTMATLALNDGARNPGDPAVQADVKHRVRTAYVRIAQLNGEDPDGAVLHADQDVALGQVTALAETDKMGAKAALAQNMDLLAGLPGTYQLQREINNGAADYMVGTLSDPAIVNAARAKFTAQPATGVPQQVGLADIQHAILGQESGNNSNVATSVDGARGPGQIMPATFARFAQPGESITNPDDNRAVANRMIAQFYKEYHGDPAKIATAYFSGEGNVAQGGSSAWKADHTDGNGKAVSSYVADIKARLGMAGAASGEDGDPDQAYLLNVRQQFQKLFPNDPGLVERGVKQVEQNIKRDDNERYATVASAAKDAADFLTNGGDPTNVTMTPQQIRQQVPGAKGADLADSLQVALDYNRAYHQITTASDAQVQQIVDAHKPTGPDDYVRKGTAYDYLVQAAQARHKAIYGNGRDVQGDPAQYLLQNNADIAKSYQGAFTNAQTFGAYMSKTQATYAAMGIPAEAQRFLPNAVAKQFVTDIQTKQPKDALGQLTAIKTEAGQSWPLILRDLARAGLSPEYQTALVVADRSPQDAQTMIDALQHDSAQKGQGGKTIDELGQQQVGGKTIASLVKSQLASDTNLASMKSSFSVGGASGLGQYLSIERSIQKTAILLYTSGRAHDPASAATQAAQMVTSKYDFAQQGGHPPVQIPRGSTDDFNAASYQVIHNLKPDDVRPYEYETGAHGEPIARSADDRAHDAYQGAQNAYWISVPGPNGAGVVRAIDPTSGKPVILRNGSTLDIPISQFKTLAIQGRATARANRSFRPAGGTGF